MQNVRKVQNCAKSLASNLPQGFVPKIGLVLGTGLGKTGSRLTASVRVPYSDLPDFPESTAASHQGHFLAGYLEQIPVLMQQGRCHLYEGRRPDEVCMGVRVMAELGISVLVLTNAAGALNPLFAAGSLMVIDDHINFTGASPLTGPNEESWGLRFPDMSEVYDRELIDTLENTALALGVRLSKGVYLGTPGPQLETRAETRAFRHLGADAVGMSTVLEAIAATHMGVRVLGISCLTNKNLPDCMDETSIEEIIAMAEKSEADLTRLLTAALPALAKS